MKIAGRQVQDVLMKVLSRFTAITYDELALVTGIDAGDILLALECLHERGEIVRVRDKVNIDAKRAIYRVYRRQDSPDVSARLSASSRVYRLTPRTPDADASLRKAWFEASVWTETEKEEAKA